MIFVFFSYTDSKVLVLSGFYVDFISLVVGLLGLIELASYTSWTSTSFNGVVGDLVFVFLSPGKDLVPAVFKPGHHLQLRIVAVISASVVPPVSCVSVSWQQVFVLPPPIF